MYQIGSSIYRTYIWNLRMRYRVGRKEKERKESNELGKILLGGLFVSIGPGPCQIRLMPFVGFISWGRESPHFPTSDPLSDIFQ